MNYKYIMDICISFDTTGSMYPVINEVKKKIVDITKTIFNDISNVRISIVAHGDYCDEKTSYLMKYLDFTNEQNSIIKFINETTNTNGGDYPEAYEYVLNKIQSFSWNNTNRALIMIGDAYPHEKNDNPYKLDWRNELEEIKKMGINIYSIQALNSGNSKCYTFYKQMAQVSNGYHLYLNQFNHIVHILMAILYKQQNDPNMNDKLSQYEKDISHEYGMNKSMRAVFDIMLGRVKTTEKIDYVDDIIDDTEDTEIIPCSPAKYQVLHVSKDTSIKDFVTENSLSFKAGKGFYEFTKPETISSKKLVVLMKKDTGDLFEGKKARKIIGLTNENKKYKPHDIPLYRVFIQSTSYNRKLIANTGFLYEADDFGK